jgi:hypothetical protein
MCLACLASLAMMIAGATSTGGVAAVLIHKVSRQEGREENGGSRQERVDSRKGEMKWQQARRETWSTGTSISQ